jgi:hypothetical protein
VLEILQREDETIHEERSGMPRMMEVNKDLTAAFPDDNPVQLYTITEVEPIVEKFGGSYWMGSTTITNPEHEPFSNEGY